MKRPNFFLSTLFIFCGLYFVTCKSAYAYLDPGLGSFFVQLLVAFAVGTMFFFKQVWAFIKDFFKKFIPKKKP